MTLSENRDPFEISPWSGYKQRKPEVAAAAPCLKVNFINGRWGGGRGQREERAMPFGAKDLCKVPSASLHLHLDYKVSQSHSSEKSQN